MKAFFKEKGLYLLCLALVFGVTIVGVLAVRSVVNNVADLTQARQKALEEDSTWNLPDTTVNKTEEDVPITSTPAPSSAPSATPSPSASSSGAASASSGSAVQSAAPAISSGSSVTAPVASAADKPATPYSGQELVYSATLGDWRTHNGADYAAETGETVYAVAAGEVSAVYEDVLWGGVVEISDGSTTWKYCGVADSKLAQGDKVSKGGQLGKIGEIPAECEEQPHLHLECIVDGQYADPEKK